MNILFCNIALSSRSGTELFLWDLARGLKRRGHGVGIFSPRTGALSEALRAEGVLVWENPRKIDWTPDILHCQHSQETWRLLDAFPAVPALYMCHDAKVWFDSPPPPPLVSKYAAVDTYCRERVVKETGCPTKAVEVIHNGVDLQKFRRKDTIAQWPERALLFVSESPDLRYIESVRAACRKLQLPLDEAGGAVGKKVSNPENHLGQYDLVFGKARCALEAMACGCAVVLVGAEGVGPLVTPAGFKAMRLRNFGRSLLQPSFDENLLVSEVNCYERASVTEVCELVRAHCGLEAMVDGFCWLYASLLQGTPTPFPPRNDALLRHGARLFEQVDFERRHHEN